ncbi:TRASH domain-containing protein [Candidatus Magnetomorum sp. HK-1]|nr:TRASH domain-containing protein [Candidatus Magnetomorum sp. HK-1]
MILRLLILWGLVYFGYRAIKSIMYGSLSYQQRESLHQQSVKTKVVDTMIQDPVCGVYFPKKDGVKAKINGKEIIFCSNDCKNKFKEQMKNQ